MVLGINLITVYSINVSDKTRIMSIFGGIFDQQPILTYVMISVFINRFNMAELAFKSTSDSRCNYKQSE